jgi:hypothetical protein
VLVGGSLPPEVVSVGVVVVSVVLEVVGSLVVLVDELVGGSVVLVVLLVVVVRLAGTVVAGGAVVEVPAGRLVRGVARGAARLDGGSRVTITWALRWRDATVVVVARGLASARCRGVVTNPTRLPPIAPMSTAATMEVQWRDSTNRIGLKTGSPRIELLATMISGGELPRPKILGATHETGGTARKGALDGTQ